MTALSDLLIADLPTTVWAAIYSQNPGEVADPVTVELLSPHYHRPQIDWTASGATLSYPTPFLFAGVPADSTVMAIGICDAPVNGNLLFVLLLDVPLHWDKGGSLLINSISVTVPG